MVNSKHQILKMAREEPVQFLSQNQQGTMLQITFSLSHNAQEFLAPPQQIDLKHIQREDQQVSSEISALTQATYKLRKQ